MNPVAVPESRVEDLRPEGFHQLTVGAPTGKLTGDGSSPEEALAVKALFGADRNGVPMFRTYIQPTQEELEILKEGGLIELVFWTTQMPIHYVDVVEGELGVSQV
jgi:hypothetical protein